jgi:hypothetical protein
MMQITWGARCFSVKNPDSLTVTVTVKGRDRWALESLMAAGPRGCTPITFPAPRWAAYVHNLREMGVQIETNNEAHGGAFRGTHARYVLRSVIAGEAVE